MGTKTKTGRRGSSRVEWPTLALIGATYAGWVAAGFILWPLHPVLAVIVLGVLLAMQSSLMHEVLHGHPTRSARFNEWLVGLPVGLVYPYRRFRALHLRHHADDSLTDPFDDPESYYQAVWKHDDLPAWLKTILKANNTMVGRVLIGPLLGTVGFVLAEIELMKNPGSQAIRTAWVLHGIGAAVVLPIVAFGFGMPIWLYVLGPVWLGQSLISVRTFAEHQWSERPDGRTVIVERSPFALLFLNNNLHLVHHKNPSVAWYRLPKLFSERREYWFQLNHGYVFPNYFAMLRTFAFKAKEPVIHPALHRSKLQGRAFNPRVRARSLNGMGSMPVPAKPPKD